VNARTKRSDQRWVLSILLHLAVVGLLLGAGYWMQHRPRPVASLGIEARVVAGDALNAMAAPPEPEPAAVPMEDPPPSLPEQPEAEPQPTPQQIAAQAEEAEQQRVAEERRLAAEREVAERKAAEARAERERREKERQEQERLAREKAEKEKAAKAERERLARLQAEKEAADKARQQREDELSRQLAIEAAQQAAEERIAAVRASGLANQYIALIRAKIEAGWIKPPSATAGLDCEVRVTQAAGGTVLEATVGRCNGDEAVRQSIVAAVLRASPLPAPPDPALFDRNLRFNFRPTK
jgi:colicin import membrane protein